MSFQIKKVEGSVDNQQLSAQLLQKLYPKSSPRHSTGFEPVAPFLEGLYFVFDNQLVVGRFALYQNPKLLWKGKKTVCIGAYECVENRAVSNAIFDFLKQKCISLKAEAFIGPMEGSTWEGYRFSDHHQSHPYLMEPYHHLYYNQQFMENGMEVIGRYVSNFDEHLTVDARVVKNSVAAFKAKGLSIRCIDMDALEEELFRIGDFCNQAFANNFLFTPIDPHYFAAKYKALQKMFVPDLIQIAEDKEGNIHGFAFSIPDYLNPDNKTLIVKSMARLKDSPYTGLGGVLGGLTYLEGDKLGLKNAIHAFVYQENPSLKVSSDQYAGADFSNYSLYGMEL